MDIDTREQLAAVQAKVRDGQELDKEEEEKLRTLILALREGRRAAATGQAKKRKAPPPPISVSTLFRRAAEAEGIPLPKTGGNL